MRNKIITFLGVIFIFSSIIILYFIMKKPNNYTKNYRKNFHFIKNSKENFDTPIKGLDGGGIIDIGKNSWGIINSVFIKKTPNLDTIKNISNIGFAIFNIINYKAQEDPLNVDTIINGIKDNIIKTQLMDYKANILTLDNYLSGSYIKLKENLNILPSCYSQCVKKILSISTFVPYQDYTISPASFIIPEDCVIYNVNIEYKLMGNKDNISRTTLNFFITDKRDYKYNYTYRNLNDTGEFTLNNLNIVTSKNKNIGIDLYGLCGNVNIIIEYIPLIFLNGNNILSRSKEYTIGVVENPGLLKLINVSCNVNFDDYSFYTHKLTCIVPKEKRVNAGWNGIDGNKCLSQKFSSSDIENLGACYDTRYKDAANCYKQINEYIPKRETPYLFKYKYDPNIFNVYEYKKMKDEKVGYELFGNDLYKYIELWGNEIYNADTYNILKDLKGCNNFDFEYYKNTYMKDDNSDHYASNVFNNFLNIGMYNNFKGVENPKLLFEINIHSNADNSIKSYPMYSFDTIISFDDMIVNKGDKITITSYYNSSEFFNYDIGISIENYSIKDGYIVNFLDYTHEDNTDLLVDTLKMDGILKDISFRGKLNNIENSSFYLLRNNDVIGQIKLDKNNENYTIIFRPMSRVKEGDKIYISGLNKDTNLDFFVTILLSNPDINILGNMTENILKKSGNSLKLKGIDTRESKRDFLYNELFQGYSSEAFKLSLGIFDSNIVKNYKNADINVLIIIYKYIKNIIFTGVLYYRELALVSEVSSKYNNFQYFNPYETMGNNSAFKNLYIDFLRKNCAKINDIYNYIMYKNWGSSFEKFLEYDMAILEDGYSNVRNLLKLIDLDSATTLSSDMKFSNTKIDIDKINSDNNTIYNKIVNENNFYPFGLNEINLTEGLNCINKECEKISNFYTTNILPIQSDGNNKILNANLFTDISVKDYYNRDNKYNIMYTTLKSGSRPGEKLRSLILENTINGEKSMYTENIPDEFPTTQFPTTQFPTT